MPDDPGASPEPAPVAPAVPEDPKVSLGFLKEFIGDLAKGLKPVPEPTPTPAVTPTATPPAPAPVPAPEAPQTVTIPVHQFQALTAAQTQLIQEQQRRDQETRERTTKEAEAALERGQLQEGLAALRKQKEDELAAVNTKLASQEAATREYAKTSELSRALAEEKLVPGALPQLMTLLGNQLNVVPEGNTYAVRTPTMQTASAFVKEMLGKPEFAHFVQAGNTGGTAGSTGGHHTSPTTPTQPTQEVVPPNMGAAAIMDVLSLMKERQQINTGIPDNLNPNILFGLKPVRS